MMNGFTTRPRYVAVAISMLNGQAYLLTSILSWTFQKSDNGDAGGWEITLPLKNPYDGALPPDTAILEYASVASPMDLVAIFAIQISERDSGSPLGPTGSTAGAISLSNLPYGDISTIQNLGTSNCVMIGMVDGYDEDGYEMSDSPMPTFTLHGKDLTKVFYVNDTLVPTTAGIGTAANSIIVNPITLAISPNQSGPALLLKALDFAVAKNLSAGGLQTSSQLQTATLAFGYEWRNFVRTDALDMSYENLTGTKYPPFKMQAGSGWANVRELANAPASRLFVNEIGQLIFDDAFAAWTTQSPNESISTDDIVGFKVSVTDDDLATFLQIFPAGALSVNQAMAAVVGSGTALGFGQGIAKGFKDDNNSGVIGQYGFRQAQFTSLWDNTVDAAKSKIKVLSYQHNALERATLILRGTTAIRVGDRITVPVTTARPNTSNTDWYVEAMNQSAQFGGPWATVCSLRFPGGSY